MRAEPGLGRSREAEEEKLYFPKQSDVRFLSNGSWESRELSQGIPLLSAMGIASLSLGWESSEWQGTRFSLGIKNGKCDSLEYSPGKGEFRIPLAGGF